MRIKSIVGTGNLRAVAACVAVLALAGCTGSSLGATASRAATPTSGVVEPSSDDPDASPSSSPSPTFSIAVARTLEEQELIQRLVAFEPPETDGLQFFSPGLRGVNAVVAPTGAERIIDPAACEPITRALAFALAEAPEADDPVVELTFVSVASGATGENVAEVLARLYPDPADAQRIPDQALAATACTGFQETILERSAVVTASAVEIDRFRVNGLDGEVTRVSLVVESWEEDGVELLEPRPRIESYSFYSTGAVLLRVGTYGAAEFGIDNPEAFAEQILLEVVEQAGLED